MGSDDEPVLHFIASYLENHPNAGDQELQKAAQEKFTNRDETYLIHCVVLVRQGQPAKIYLCIQHVATIPAGPHAGSPINAFVSTSPYKEAAFKFQSSEEAEDHLKESQALINVRDYTWRVEENLPWFLVSGQKKDQH